MPKAKQQAEEAVEAIKGEVTDGNTKEGNQAAAEAAQKPAEEVKTAETGDSPAKKPLAKSGKRSAKAIKEAETLAAKKERKEAGQDEKDEKPKQAQKPARSKLERRGKKFREAAKLIEKGKEYPLEQAVELAAKTSTTKFDATVELHVRLSVDPRHSDQNVRDSLILPAGTGKVVRVAVFAEDDDAAKAKAAGADLAGTDTITGKLEKGIIEFDTLIATPAVMARLGKFARLLGPKGLMPNPKSGTVTGDVAKAVKDAKAGKVDYRVDSTGIVHVGIGKVSFGADKLLENANAVIASIKAAKPASVKGTYVRSAFVTTSMGPSVKVATAAL